ncbi:NADH-dependent phenylglyoxylate dehydrogenase subunit epsilon [Magnetospirillum sp. LM-5]|uniref:NADH-dependent phenylglyoxylate dehydrogenase subunit epsilon n=1 Tax=Magnetospirillum sp. LM-5 TaxID=2681466 RepID=UPI00137FA690|nr:FAD-dependent oxidoreductase [Magnetospirillum sp. LM-5]CAA7625976.1 NADH-dependent phenylglyoxylate dehydrogenase subunit epsilon [Magnetospirillum sp. LM-5]
MPEAKYLLVGSSHAGLEALRAIRRLDSDGSMAMLTKDSQLPYSPTVLPYVMSGRSKPDAVILRDQAFFDETGCVYAPGQAAQSLDTKARVVTLADGVQWRYERLLIATGAAPAIPPIPGLQSVPFHVLRTLDDAVTLRTRMGLARRAVVLGAGLVGLHAAETLAEAGLAVSVIEMKTQVLPGYIDAKASARIEAAFASHGIKLLLGRTATQVAALDGGVGVTTDDGRAIEGDMLLVATGVRSCTEWLAGSGIEIDRGVLVDDRMRTSAPDVWAAGDVAQGLDFASGERQVLGIIPTAVEQGRIAGFDMAGDAKQKPWVGGLPVNTYRFFGRPAVSVGQAAAVGDGFEVVEQEQPRTYRRIVLADNRLVGIITVDDPFDAGIMGELIRRRVDLGAVKESFLADPTQVGRRLMSEMWR